MKREFVNLRNLVTATGPRHSQLGDGYKAAVINFGFLANAVLTTEAVKAMK